MPISGTTHAVFGNALFSQFGTVTDSYSIGTNPGTSGNNKILVSNAIAQANLKNALDGNTVDLSTASTFDIADLRLAFQIQKWMERNARAGVRYTEFLRAHFGVSPRDERLQRPEYIGGSKAPVLSRRYCRHQVLMQLLLKVTLLDMESQYQTLIVANITLRIWSYY